MKPVIVVEGNSDVSRLKNLIDYDFVITNGSAINKETLEYLKELKKTREIIVFTDPDSPGNRIRNIIDEYLGGVKHCYVRKKYAIKGKKVGVCECEEKEILRALSEVINFPYDDKQERLITSQDLYLLSLNGKPDSQKRRDYISEKIPIGRVNAKMFLKRVNQLNINLKDLQMWMEEYDSK